MFSDYDKWKLSDGLENEVIVAECEQCGLEIYEDEDVYVIKASGDIIHKDCFDDYALAALDAVLDLAKRLREE